MKNYFKNLRKFHNSIKRNLYNKYAKNVGSLLELAVGKGGDIDKWCSNNIKHVIGYDINEESITECKKRVKNKQVNCKTKVQVYTKDLSVNIINLKFKVDIVSAMFSFHYFFKNKSTFDTVILSIKSNLKSGGLFIGCFFDGDSVNNFLKTNSNNNEFTITKEGKFKKGLFGNKINVYIKGTVLDKPEIEYVVDFTQFVKKMESLGFQLISSELFVDLYDTKFKLSKEEKLLSFLNRTFVFKLI
jgi:SAM-dependent methyltransferase